MKSWYFRQFEIFIPRVKGKFKMLLLLIMKKCWNLKKMC